ncbi:MAG: protein-disulfide reductase DsbD family protein [Planctomycetota bacterium]|nr:protein-disulfide reductase DsbD family protein [Planctomycetota bacterium]
MRFNRLRFVGSLWPAVRWATPLIGVTVLLSIAVATASGQPGGFPDLGLSGFGSGGAAGQKVTISAAILPPEAGRPATLSVTADILPGWHIYSITQKKGGPRTTLIQLAEANNYRLTGPFQSTSAPKIHQEKFWPGLDIEEHENRVSWTAPLEPLGGTDLSQLVVSGNVRTQVCANVCIDLDLPFEARWKSGQSAAAPPGTNQSAEQPATSAAAPRVPLAAEGPTEFRASNVVVTGRLDKRSVAPGDTVNLTIALAPAAGWHVYELTDRLPKDRFASRPTLIVMDGRVGFQATRPVADKPVLEKVWQELDGKIDRYYQGPVSWTVPLSAPSQLGEHALSGYVGFQACSDAGMCAIPTAARFQVNLQVGEASVPGIVPVTFAQASYNDVGQLTESLPPWDGTLLAASADSSGDGQANSWHTIGRYLLFAFLAGLILNVMPCVLPVIGLKVMSFVRQAGEDRGRIFQLNLWYVLGIMSVFMALAALAAFANLGWGQQFQTPEVGIALAAVVFVFALSLLGVWEIPIPGFVGTGAAAEVAEREGAAGAFCKGILTTILATPCSGPFLGTALAWALAQQKAVIFATFASMGLGMASPYLVLSVSPGLIRFLPKPGAWMETFKELMGFVLLGTVVWIFTFVKEEYRVATLGLLVGLWVACWMFGRVPMTASGGGRIKAALLGGAFALLVGWFSFHWLVPGEEWEPYTPNTLAQLRDEGATVLVDFTADS